MTGLQESAISMRVTKLACNHHANEEEIVAMRQLRHPRRSGLRQGLCQVLRQGLPG